MAGARNSSKAKAAATTDVVTAAKAALAARKKVTAAVMPPPPAPALAVAEPRSASDWENPDKLTGEELRALAHRRGVARSEAETMSDDKLRMQLRYITSRQYAEEE